MIRKAKLAALRALKSTAAFDSIADSRWRRQRLLILCYHGISIDDEHLWRPQLYMPAEKIDQRLASLCALRCSVLPLGEALTRLRVGDLPPRSVAITFDDGTFDFYEKAYPLLKKYRLPATVYQSTYYSDHPLPVFNLFCSYLLWKRRGKKLPAMRDLGFSELMDLQTERTRHRVVRALIEFSERERLTGREKDELAQKLAQALAIDYTAIVGKRILHLMEGKEIAEIARNGIDVQLHTHRHRTPEEESAFRREVIDNRERVESLTGKRPDHFCYPAGVHRQAFVEWLMKEDVASAVTCDVGLAERGSNPYLLPRFVDTSGRTQLEFESWISGVGSLLALRKASRQRYAPAADR